MITLNTIVNDVLSEMGMNTTHNYARLLNIANKGLRTLTFDVLGKSKVVLLTVDSDLRIDLPTDFIDYTFVGVVGNDGWVQTLGARDDIPKYGTGNLLIQNEEYFAGFNGGVFGAGGGQNLLGYYQPQIDQDNNQMIFAAKAVGSVIYLEYISDGSVATTNETVVPEYAEEALNAYVYWKAIQKRRGATAIEKQMARKDWFNEKRLAVARTSSFTKEEALTASRKGFKQSPKL
jgi:hypothetical protein